MKKVLSIFCGAMLMLMLAACGQAAEPVQKEGEAEKPAAKAGSEEAEQASTESKESELTLEDVFKKTEEANKDVNSFKSQMKMNQVVDIAGDKQEINSDIDMEFILDPMALHQKMTMSLAGEKQDIDAYLTKDGFFMYEPNEQQWIKLPEEFSGQILQMSDNQSNPSDQLDQLKEFLDDFEFQQDDQNYILTLKASGDKFDQFLMKNAKETLPAEMQDENILENMKFNQVDYELLINKETFYLHGLNMLMDMDVTAEEQKMNMQIDFQSTYSDFNEVGSIEVPKEALENAQEINMDDLDGQ